MITILNESFSGLEPLTDKEVAEIMEIKRKLFDLQMDGKRELPSINFQKQIDALKPYQSGIANKNNFFYCTLAVFTPCKRPKKEPDYISKNRVGDVSSEYWYSNEGVVRCSDHWGTGVASCDWALKDIAYGTRDGSVDKTRKRCGFCKWEDFVRYPDIKTTEDTNESYLTTFDNTTSKGEYEIDGKLYAYDRNTRTLVLLYDPKVEENHTYECFLDDEDIEDLSFDEIRELVIDFADSENLPYNDISIIEKKNGVGTIRVRVVVSLSSESDRTEWTYFPTDFPRYLRKVADDVS